MDEWLDEGMDALTCYEADPPQARVQRHLDLGGLILLQDDSLLHQQPVVC